MDRQPPEASMILTSASLHERVALVTGAGSPSGIGMATARLLGAMGAKVVLGSTTSRVDQRVSELRDLGIDALGLVGDLTDPTSAPKLVASALEQWARLDVVVANAGMVSQSDPTLAQGLLESIDLDEWHAGLARNLDSSFLVAKAAMPALLANGWGRLIFVASVTGPVMAMRAQPVYGAAKAGLVGLTKALALDTAGSGVTVNAVAPGWIATGSQTAFEASEGALSPVGRSGTPDEVASLIGWLASPGSSYMTGQCLILDGGNSIDEERSRHTTRD